MDQTDKSLARCMLVCIFMRNMYVVDSRRYPSDSPCQRQDAQRMYQGGEVSDLTGAAAELASSADLGQLARQWRCPEQQESAIGSPVR
jgi:hypothetical protein